jgi:hypothetical protein
MGISCHVPNRLTCDRVGISVSLEHPASGLRVLVAGKKVRMSSDNQRVWQGFLDPAGLTTRGSALYVGAPGSYYNGGGDRPLVTVHMEAHYDRGVDAQADSRVDLHPGWG